MLNKGGYDKARSLVEVYNHPQPPRWVQIPSEEALSTRNDVLFASVRACDRVQYGLDVADHLWTALSEMTLSAQV